MKLCNGKYIITYCTGNYIICNIVPIVNGNYCYTVSYKAILLCLRCTEVSRHLGWAKLAVGGSEYHAHATGFEWMTQGCERKQRINCVLQHLLYYTPILTAIYNMTRYSI